MKDLIAFAAILSLCGCLMAERLVTGSFERALRDQVTWEVVSYEDNLFKGWTVEEMKNILSAERNLLTELPTEYDDGIHGGPLDPSLPENFDPRKKWPTCIHPIRNQGKCGSCWAHGATEALSDRFCIAGKDVILSPQDLVSCDPHDKACNGGGDIVPYMYMTNPGVVTDSCFPYSSGQGVVPPCAFSCLNNEPYVRYSCKMGSVFVKGTTSSQQQELYANGPLSSAFDVYQDFMYYKTGIYYHKSGDYLGGHAIKVIGWGVESGMEYWLCANSWSATWGEQGFFRIKIEDSSMMERGVGCTPSL